MCKIVMPNFSTNVTERLWNQRLLMMDIQTLLESEPKLALCRLQFQSWFLRSNPLWIRLCLWNYE